MDREERAVAAATLGGTTDYVLQQECLRDGSEHIFVVDDALDDLLHPIYAFAVGPLIRRPNKSMKLGIGIKRAFYTSSIEHLHPLCFGILGGTTNLIGLNRQRI